MIACASWPRNSWQAWTPIAPPESVQFHNLIRIIPMSQIIDPVPNDTPGAQEINFSVPQHYNASAILFDNLTAGRGGKIAIVTERESLTYGEICAQACRIGNGLLDLGLVRGDRLVLVLNDSPDYIAAIFGALRAGLVPLLINTLSPADQIAFFLEDSAATVALTHGEHLGLFSQSSPKHLIVLDSDEGRAWISKQSPDLPQADTSRDDMAFWMYSSGSTGKPKGVVHLHHDMAYTVESYAKRVLQIRESDICFSVPKIFFAYGFGNSVTFPFAVGA
ncbi:MAG TPA: hypothetical protein DD390_18120, partial [Rhodospirillaceae bacterium]|nr:hypothetical protein [Rhodospirillaceae bacterium]